MSIESIQDVVDALSERVKRSVAVDDHTLRLVAVGRDYGDADPARIWSLLHRQTRPDDVDYANLRTLHEPVKIPANPHLELESRLCVPIRHQGMLLGFIWLIDSNDSITDEQRADVQATSVLLGVLMQQRLMITDHQAALSAYLVDGLLGPAAETRSAAASEILSHGLITEDAHVGVLVLRITGGPGTSSSELPAIINKACRTLTQGSWLASIKHSQASLVLASGRDLGTELAKTAARLLDCVSDYEWGSQCRIGIGGLTQGIGYSFASQRQALIALDVAEALRDGEPLASWEKLGAYALVAQLPLEVVDNELLPLGLFKLLRTNPSQQLLKTLEAFLDCAGDKQRTAKALSIHRTTLYYRLDRIEELSGMALDDGNNRLMLHLAVKMRNLAPLNLHAGPGPSD